MGLYNLYGTAYCNLLDKECLLSRTGDLGHEIVSFLRHDINLFRTGYCSLSGTGDCNHSGTEDCSISMTECYDLSVLRDSTRPIPVVQAFVS